MKATEILKSEHRMIEQVLNCLEKMAETACVSRVFDRDSAREALEFFRHFADRCHHGKEEDILFQRMIERGFPRQAGPLAVMLHEHELGRSHVRALAGIAANDRAAAVTVVAVVAAVLVTAQAARRTVRSVQPARLAMG